MNIENQVCSLELAKKLKELGVLQESFFIWWQFNGGKLDELNLVTQKNVFVYGREVCSAFTVAELGELLPVQIQYKGCAAFKTYWENGSRDLHSVAYHNGAGRNKTQRFAKTEADARAEMLIFLIEDVRLKF